MRCVIKEEKILSRKCKLRTQEIDVILAMTLHVEKKQKKW